MYRVSLISLLFLSICSQVLAQAMPANTIWQRHLGSPMFEYPSKIVPFQNGYLIIGGHQRQYEEQLNSTDMMLYKVDLEGHIIWKKFVNLGGDDYASDIILTDDGGFLLLGSSNCWSGNKLVSNADPDYSHLAIVKCNADGRQVWNQCIGTSGNDHLSFIGETSKGELYFAGSSDSQYVDGDKTVGYGDYDIWIVKTNKQGQILWEKTYGGSGYDSYKGGWLDKDTLRFAVYTQSQDYDCSDNPDIQSYWFVSVNDANGNILSDFFKSYRYHKTFETSKLVDGSRLIYGQISWLDEKPEEHHDSLPRYLLTDAYFRVVSKFGSIGKSHLYGGNGRDFFRNVRQLTNGNLLFWGNTESKDGDLEGTGNDSHSGWLVEVDTSGTIVEMGVYGKPGGGSYKNEFLMDVLVLEDGSYMLLLNTENNDYPTDVYYNDDVELGNDDIWLIKTNHIATGLNEFYTNYNIGVGLFPNPAQNQLTLTSYQRNNPVVSYSITNLQGEQFALERQANSASEINISIDHLSKGIYIITTTLRSGKRISKRFIKL